MINISSFLIVMLITIVWGYFADLRKGQIGWFVGRIISMTFFFAVFSLILYK